ncbi:MAG TPA: lamin tail domain-containing protein [Longimicrobium sp.]|nr:lamin tail domain-containing protein [Longimicrobium sp.]
MSRPTSFVSGFGRLVIPAVLGAAALGACAERQPVAPADVQQQPIPLQAVQAFDCTGSTTSGALSCRPSSAGTDGQGAGVIIGGQNSNLKLTSSNVSYNGGTEIFQFDLTVQNLMNEAIGTPDGVVADPQGIQVFFNTGPTVLTGSGEITVANADGTDSFTGASQPFFAYHEILAKDAVSGAKPWQLQMPATVGTFSFTLYVETDVQYLLVINEVMVNSAGVTIETTGDWFEVYNAGTRKVNLQGLVIADSAASGRRPYHAIGSSVVVLPGAYVVLGNTTNTTQNGGVPVDYAFGGSISLASSLDAIKIARVYGTDDTLTVDRTQYANPVSTQDGVSRELTNPALDNSNMDGSNWASALVTAVYGPGGRGTPKAQNSTYTP